LATLEVLDDWPVILLIENDDADVFLFRRALARLSYNCRVHAVATTTQAKAYLENSGSYRDEKYYIRPKLIVSDFKLTGETALHFVRWVRNHARFNDIPIVILSGFVSRLDPALFEGLSVQSFLRKTADISELGAMLRPILP
jgi:CheY-like chemotaxis protein